MRDGSLGAGAEEPKKAGVAPTARTASLNDMRPSEKAEVLEKA